MYYIDGNLVVVLVVLLYIILRAIVVFRKRPLPIHVIKEITYFAFVLYLSMVVSVTLFPLFIGDMYPVENIFRNVNLVPFKTVIMDIHLIGVAYNGDTLFMISLIARNVLGNVLLLMPFGFLAPIIWRRLRSFQHTLLVGFLISLTIESIQLLESSIGMVGRITDIDDLICNTLGAVIGYFIYKVFVLLVRKYNLKSFENLVA